MILVKPLVPHPLLNQAKEIYYIAISLAHLRIISTLIIVAILHVHPLLQPLQRVLKDIANLHAQYLSTIFLIILVEQAAIRLLHQVLVGCFNHATLLVQALNTMTQQLQLAHQPVILPLPSSKVAYSISVLAQ